MTHLFATAILQNDGMDAGYVIVPVDIRKLYGRGRVKVRATFDGYPYSGSVVNMGLRDKDGNICYIIGVTKAVRKAIGKTFGDIVDVTITVENQK